MDTWEGRATLEWWANASTCFAGFGVRVTVCVAREDWECEAALDPPLSAAERAAFEELMRDPLWTLRIGEDKVRIGMEAVDGERLAFRADEERAA